MPHSAVKTLNCKKIVYIASGKEIIIFEIARKVYPPCVIITIWINVSMLRYCYVIYFKMSYIYLINLKNNKC